MKTVRVNLSGGRGYPIIVGAGAMEEAGEYAAEVSAVISNETVRGLYGERLQTALEARGKKAHFIELPDGEQYKTMQSLQQIIDGMLAARLERDSGVIALGGGIVGDVAGFAAAVYMRGVPALQIPTTLLAQVDAAIGGKTGVNHPAGKNLIGAFHQPRAVLADTAVLESLPAREYNAGLAEVIKYGLLGDAGFFEYLEQHRQDIARRAAAAQDYIIAASAQAKADIVAADETEQSGRRALLNLGHTFAHAAETAVGYGGWLHGEAVAFGLVAAARLSEQVCGFPIADTARIIALLEALALPAKMPAGVTAAQLLAAMGSDKKNVSGKKRFILMKRIGEAFVAEAPDEEVIAALGRCS